MFKSQDYNPYSFDVRLDNGGNFRLDQDIQAYREYAHQQRLADEHAPTTRQYRSFAIIPDIVAIDILTKYGIDIHAPDFMHNTEAVRKFKKIIQEDYPLLMTSNVKKVV
ncbi:MAG TPA: hypothetical protein P5539_05750 [Mesotoga sp.]|nr:hypothetical protein [Mesotoga sp.]